MYLHAISQLNAPFLDIKRTNHLHIFSFTFDVFFILINLFLLRFSIRNAHCFWCIIL